MTDAKHTPEPWDVVPANEHHGFYITSDFGNTICDLYTMSDPGVLSPDYGKPSKPVSFMHEMAGPNAARIVACVNACEGIADPSVVPELVAVLREVNAELFEYASITINGEADTRLKGMVERADAILAKATGAAR